MMVIFISRRKTELTLEKKSFGNKQSCLKIYRYPPYGLELQEGEMLGQLHRFQVVKQQRGLAFLSLLLALGQLTHPVI